ncbi:12793_t:CDS:2 [Funneliformis geosporum]|uniref:12793_t:CDS:1 n=1 Tax=Funneliformis geosporum TaxID=1117311 RepID=A0A9W4SX19_9GLOM|nr:12793_t:CDS:2 [Funneliformis geosporum]
MANGEKRLITEDRMERKKVSKRRQTGTTAKDDIELFQSPPSSPLLTPKSSHLTTSLEAPSQLQTPLSSPPSSRPPSPNPVDVPYLTPLPTSRPPTPTFIKEISSTNVTIITIVTNDHSFIDDEFIIPDLVFQQQNRKNVSHLPLKVVNSSIPPCARCPPEIIYHIFEILQSLHTINLSFVKGITNGYLTKLLSPFFNNVRTLNLAGGSRSDTCLSSIIPNCSKVQNLSLAWNTSLSDASINKIATICGDRLRTLDLTNCEKVSDRSMHSISKYCLKLRELRVSYCRGVSEEGVRAVFEACEGLRLLDLVGCLGVDKCFLLKCNDEFGLSRRDLKVIWRRFTDGNTTWTDEN